MLIAVELATLHYMAPKETGDKPDQLNFWYNFHHGRIIFVLQNRNLKATCTYVQCTCTVHARPG